MQSNNNIKYNQFLIDNFDLLKKSGILDRLNYQQNIIEYQEQLLHEACEIFSKYSIMKLIDHIVNKLLAKFIPSSLVFVIQDDYAVSGAKIISYINMKLEKNQIQINSFSPYERFFSLSPASITFEAFENMMDKKELTDIFKPLGPKILVPMLGLEGTYGFFILGKKLINTEYTENEKNYINIIMKFASISLQNIIHYQKASIDQKTKLYTYSYFQQKLSEELSRVKRYKSVFSILMLDIDHFKKVNDTYGHLTGDKILQDLSRLMLKNIRQEDIAARFGGEEFIIILIEKKPADAFQAAEKIRKIIESYNFTDKGHKIQITVSIGITHINSDEIYDSEEIIRRADLALYQSKTNGRNRTSLYS
jgi:diguanylate cyclase (GGDEF)-like protein